LPKEDMHFQPFQVPNTKVNQKVGAKSEESKPIFTNGTRFEFFYKNSTNSNFKKEHPKEKDSYGILCLHSSIMCSKNFLKKIKG